MKKMICVLVLALLTLAMGETRTVSAKLLYSSKTNVTVEKGKKTAVNIKFKKNGKVYWTNMNTNIVKASWGKSTDGNKLKLNLKGKKVGNTKVIITNSRNKEKIVIRVKVKKKSVINPKARKRLKVPKNATYTVQSYKFYWSGGPCHLIHVEVHGTGKYQGYFAQGDFSTDYESAKSVYHWTLE